MTKCLGKLPVRHDRRTLRVSKYLQLVPPAPDSCAWNRHTPDWPMMLNDTIGDCTIAASGHMIQFWTADNYGGTGHVVSDEAVVAAYSALTGYDPVTGKNDNGAVELDVLNYWRKTGIGGHNIWAYASVNTKNEDRVKQAAYLFGGLYIGLNLPLSAQKQNVWCVPRRGPRGRGAPGSWGGHAVPVVAYDAQGLTVVTWGGLQDMTWAFWNAYCDEAYAIIGGSDWMKGTEPIAPNGFDLAALQADFQSLSV